MKRRLWLLMLFLFAGHVPAASADSACEGRFVNPITDICWSCIFPLSLGSIKVSQGKVPDTANPSMPIQICPAPPPLFRRIGLAIGYWEPMALTDVIRDVLLEDISRRNIPLSHKKLRRALKAITRSESYLCAMKAGACRYDTEGYVTEHISQEEEAYAAARLDKTRRQNRIKAELQAVLDEK
ncbi:TPA: fertility inhibition protein FinO [Escherichia coli]